VRLWRQLAFVMALIAVVPAAVLGALAISTVDDEWRQASEQRVRRDAGRRADDLGAWLLANKDFVADVPSAFLAEDRSGFTPAQQTGLLFLLFNLARDAEIVVMVDESARLVVPAVPADMASQVGPLLEHLPPLEPASEAPRIGTAWSTPAGPRVPLAVKVADTPSGARFLGVQLAMPVEGASDDTQGVGLLRQDGQPLVVSGPLVQPEQLAPLLGVFEEFETDEPEPAHGALAQVAGSPGWTFVVVEPERALLRLSQRITGQILVGALVASVVGIAAALATALTVSRPVAQLRTRALQLADGALGIRVGIERNDEIGELATAFDHLSAQLETNQIRIEEQQTEIEAFNAELQSRVEDRTQKLREAQDQLVRTSQLAAVAELGAGLAHDLNNPLTGVLGIAQVLKGRHPDDELIASLEREAQRCREVVSAMQRATTLEVDPTRTVASDVSEMVRRAAEWVAPSYAQRGVTLEIVPPDEGVDAALDPDHATRILAQILQSVRSGLPGGSGVTVRVVIERDGEAPARIRDRPAIWIEADRPVAEQPQHRDDWLTASRVMWVTVQLIDRLGGVLLRPEEGRVWHWVL